MEPTGGASPTPTSRKAATRRRLLRVAENLFAELGFAGVSASDVALEARIGRTTFYEYFTDMEDLLAALVEARLPEVVEELLTAIPRHLPARHQLAELTMRMIEFAVTDHFLGLELHQELPALAPSTQARIGAAHRGLSSELSRIYRTGVAEGEFRALPTDLAGMFIRDVVMSGAKALMSMASPKDRLHEIADEVVAFLLGGLAPPGGPGSAPAAGH